jgi:hypothetical protein
VAATGEISWPPAGRTMSTYGEDLTAVDIGECCAARRRAAITLTAFAGPGPLRSRSVVTARPLGPRYDVAKIYAKRGPMQQFRLAQSLSFACYRCGQEKTSKLVTVLDSDSGKVLCNGCYGRLLSIYEIKAGTTSTTSKADALLEQMEQLAPADQARRGAALLSERDDRASRLDPRALRMLTTSEFVANELAGATSLDWSAAVIGLCKAVELEVAVRLVEPLRVACSDFDLTPDLADQHLGRLAAYCSGKGQPPSSV